MSWTAAIKFCTCSQFHWLLLTKNGQNSLNFTIIIIFIIIAVKKTMPIQKGSMYLKYIVKTLLSLLSLSS